MRVEICRILVFACSIITSYALVRLQLDQMLAVFVNLVVAKVTDVFLKRGIGLESCIVRLNVLEHLEELTEPANFFLFFLSISILPSFVKFINGSSDDALFLFI